MRRLQSYSSLAANPKDSGFSALAKKLRLQPGHVVAILNAPPGYQDRLEPGPAAIVTELKADHLYDAVILFVQDADGLRAMRDTAVAAVKPDGLLWVAHANGAWNNGAVAEIFGDTGYRPIALVKIDEGWTAVRLKKAG